MIVTVTLNPCVDYTLFVPEIRPHDTNRVGRSDLDAGGKGVNVSRIVRELGGASAATGFLGGHAAVTIADVLASAGALVRFANIAGETRVNFAVEDESGRPPTTFNSPGPRIMSDEWNELMAICNALAVECDWVTLGGSLPPGLGHDAFAELANLFHAAGARVALDSDGEPMRLGMLANPDFIKPNEKEAGRMLGRTVVGVSQAVDAAIELHAGGDGPELTVVSIGALGAVLACPNGVFYAKPPQVEPVSTVGAGDSLVGGFLQTYVETGDPVRALQVGTAAGTATSLTDGSCIAGRRAIHDLIDAVNVARVE